MAVVGASLQRLVTPRLDGARPGMWPSPPASCPRGRRYPDPAAAEPDREALLADPDIEAAAIVLYDEQITINGVEAISMTLDPVKGGIAPTVIEGREPQRRR